MNASLSGAGGSFQGVRIFDTKAGMQGGTVAHVHSGMPNEMLRDEE